VQDEETSPVKGCEVYLVPQGAYAVPAETLREVGSLTRSGSDGSFALSSRAGPGAATLLCRKRGFVPAVLPMPGRPEQEEVIVTLLRGGRIRGRVVSASGEGVPHARVSARQRSVQWLGVREGAIPGPGAIRSAATRTDGDGRFELTGLDPKASFLVEAWAAGYVMVQAPGSFADSGWIRPDGADVEITMEPSLVAVLRFRQGRVDVTPVVRTYLETHRNSCIRLPPGSKPGFPGVPSHLFDPQVTRRLLAASKDSFVVFAGLRESGRGEPPAEGITAQISIEIAPSLFVRRPFRLRPIGTAGWDQVQSLDLAPELALAFGELELVDETDPRWRRIETDPVAVWAIDAKSPLLVRSYSLGSGWARNRQVLTIPAGKYTVSRPSGTRAYRVDIHPGCHVLLRLEFPKPRIIRLHPIFPSDAPALGVTFYLRGRETEAGTGTGAVREYRHRMEPNGCLSGDEIIALGPASEKVRLSVLVKKTGYEPVLVAVPHSGDVVLRPVLKPR